MKHLCKSKKTFGHSETTFRTDIRVMSIWDGIDDIWEKGGGK